MGIRELTTRERNECIGLAIDADLDVYHKHIDNMNLDGDSGDRNIAAAILTMAEWGYVDDYKEEYEGDNVAPHMDYRWGRSVLAYDGKKNQYKLNIYHNKDRAKKEMTK